MRQVLDTVWQRRGTSWLWDEEARNTVCAAGEVWSLRQFLQAAAPGAQGWPDDLPSNGGQTLLVAGLEGLGHRRRRVAFHAGLPDLSGLGPALYLPVQGLGQVFHD